MKAPLRSIIALTMALCALLVSPAQATFHLMQIEQVIGGANGDVTAQAIQLRQRSAGQNVVSFARIRAWDANGLNPVLIIDMTTDVLNSAAGDRILITTPAFQTYVSPAQTPNFTMTNLIPASYLPAGSLTFEQDSGTIYWRLSWGGAGYTGPGNMNTLNDANGNANPPVATALPSTGTQALKFSGVATAMSTTNLADYALTADASVWVNNARQSETLGSSTGVGDPPLHPVLDPIQLSRSFPNPTRGASQVSFTLAAAGRVTISVYDSSGRLVRGIVDQEMEPGPHQATWDGLSRGGSRVPPGVYFLRLDALGESRTTRLVEAR